MPDDNIDYFILVWRVNSAFAPGSNGGLSGYVEPVNLNGKMVYFCSIIKLDNGNPGTLERHELAHNLLGPNEFHTVGNNAGVKKIMPTLGGWSMLSGWSNRGQIYNAFDRWRMGWKSVDTPYEISTINPTSGNPVNSDLEYGEAFPEGTQEFVLRDFVSTGDALRIKLPYLKSINSEVFEQYIWLENHQNISGYYDLRRNPNWSSNEGKGIYAYIQLGKDIRIGTYNEVYKETTQYIFPLIALGNFDPLFENVVKGDGKSIEENTSSEEWLSRSVTKADLILNYDKINPLTGHHHLLEHPYNYNDPDIINDVPYYNTITRSETIWVDKVIVDGVEMPQSDFVSTSNTQPIWGTKYDVFAIGRNIGLGTNPPSTPIYTYETVYDKPNEYEEDYDNRHIFLNGLNIEIMEQLGDGSIKARVSYDHYDVAEDTRWCGNIVLNEQVNLLEGNSINIDQGYTPTNPYSQQEINGEHVYAQPTVFTCNPGSEFIQNENSNVVVNQGSTLYLNDSFYHIKDGATLTISAGSTLKFAACATLQIDGDGQLIIEDDAIVSVGDRAILAFENARQNVSVGNNVTFTNETFEDLLPGRYIIDQNTTWDAKNYKIFRDILVTTGYDLNIENNTTLELGDNGRIIIEKGAKMIVDNSTLTNDNCGDFLWQGIRVKGTSNAPQNETDQGVLEVKNASIIEKAEVAI